MMMWLFWPVVALQRQLEQGSSTDTAKMIGRRQYQHPKRQIRKRSGDAERCVWRARQLERGFAPRRYRDGEKACWHSWVLFEGIYSHIFGDAPRLTLNTNNPNIAESVGVIWACVGCDRRFRAHQRSVILEPFIALTRNHLSAALAVVCR